MLKQKFSQSQSFRMVAVAIAGAIIGFLTYELIYLLNPLESRATSSWTFAFFVGVARQHHLHRIITFKSKSPYPKSLFRAYTMYSGSALSGALLNYFLTDIYSINHHLAWFVCLIFTSLISLFLLKRYVFSTGLPSQSERAIHE